MQVTWLRSKILDCLYEYMMVMQHGIPRNGKQSNVDEITKYIVLYY